MGDDGFTRLRVGVGGPGEDMVNHVLGHFSGHDAEAMKAAFEKAADAIECIVTNGPETAMNRFNTRKDEA